MINDCPINLKITDFQWSIFKDKMKTKESKIKMGDWDWHFSLSRCHYVKKDQLLSEEYN